MKLSYLLSCLLSVIVPPRCFVCGHPLPHTRNFLCAGCLAELPLAAYNNIHRNPMADVLLSMREGEAATAFMRYSIGNAVSTLVHDIKYHGYSQLARALGQEAARQLAPTGIFADVDMLLPVPLFFLKKWKRGYNQSEMIARGISDITGIPVGSNLIALHGHTSQTTLDATARQTNVEGVYGVRRPEELDGRTVLIVDDVFTTGATMMSAAHAIADESLSTGIRLFALASAYHC